jgi:glucan phosphoethanolaminetransferase (alkaline phosphatase superfamily)
MIMRPDKRRSGNGSPQDDKLTGGLKQAAIAAAVVELVVFWLLVFGFPLVMAPVSLLLAGIAHYFHRTGKYRGTFGEELNFSERDIELVGRYVRTWTYIALYGALFALFLLWKK